MAKPDQLVRPCAKCPFRTDIKPYLTRARIRGLERDIVQRQGDFYCHQTTKEVDSDDGGTDMAITSKSKRCAGMAILCEKINRPTQMMRIDERLGFYDRRLMDMDAPVYETFAEMRKAQTA